MGKEWIGREGIRGRQGESGIKSTTKPSTSRVEQYRDSGIVEERESGNSARWEAS